MANRGGNDCGNCQQRLETKGLRRNRPRMSVTTSTLEPDLQAIIGAWPTLPESVKADILAMV